MAYVDSVVKPPRNVARKQVSLIYISLTLRIKIYYWSPASLNNHFDYALSTNQRIQLRRTWQIQALSLYNSNILIETLCIFFYINIISFCRHSMAQLSLQQRARRRVWRHWPPPLTSSAAVQSDRPPAALSPAAPSNPRKPHSWQKRCSSCEDASDEPVTSFWSVLNYET